MEDKLLNNYINHLNKVKRNDIHFQDVSHLLIFMRLILEKENLKKEYPNISFFSNWYLHASLDRDKFAKQKLNSIYLLMQSRFSIDREDITFNDSDDFYTQMSEIIGLNDLKEEIKKFLIHFSISNNFNNINYSDGFLKLYLTGICERPLIFQDKNLKLYNNILIRGFQFIEIENKIHFKILTDSISNSFVFKFFNKD